MSNALLEIVRTLDLKKPIKHGNQTIDKLEFMELRFKHLKGVIQPISFDDYSIITQRITNQPPSVIGELAMTDMQAAMEIIGSFLSESPMVGKPSQES